MKNLFLSPTGLLKNVFNKLEIIQTELRAQRQDNVQILFLLNKILVDSRLQKQVDDYFDETSHQTDSEEHFESKPGDIRVD